MSERWKKIGVRIARLREAAKISQSEMARRIGVQQSRLSRIEKGEYACRIHEANAIARELGVTTADLAGAAPSGDVSEPHSDYKAPVSGRSAILANYSSPPGLQLLASDTELCSTLKITDAELRNLTALTFDYPISKEGYISILFAIRAASHQVGVTGS